MMIDSYRDLKVNRIYLIRQCDVEVVELRRDREGEGTGDSRRRNDVYSP